MVRAGRSGTVPVLVVLLLAGCTSDLSSSGGDEPPLGPIPLVTSPDQVTRPIDAYLPDTDQNLSLMFAGRDLVNDCLAEDGGQPEAAILEFDGSLGGLLPASRAYVRDYVDNLSREEITYSPMWEFFDPDTVGRYGYDRPPGVSHRIAMNGIGSDDPAMRSCVTRIDAVTPGGQVMTPLDVSALPDGGPPLPIDDSRFLAAAEEWSACMSEHGFDYQTPQEAISDNYAGPDGEPLTAEEKVLAKAVAVADVQCKIETNLVGVAVAVQSAYEQGYIDSHRDALENQQREIADYMAGRVEVPASPSGSESESLPGEEAT